MAFWVGLCSHEECGLEWNQVAWMFSSRQFQSWWFLLENPALREREGCGTRPMEMPWWPFLWYLCVVAVWADEDTDGWGAVQTVLYSVPEVYENAGGAKKLMAAGWLDWSAQLGGFTGGRTKMEVYNSCINPQWLEKGVLIRCCIVGMVSRIYEVERSRTKYCPTSSTVPYRTYLVMENPFICHGNNGNNGNMEMEMERGKRGKHGPLYKRLIIYS